MDPCNISHHLNIDTNCWSLYRRTKKLSFVMEGTTWSSQIGMFPRLKIPYGSDPDIVEIVNTTMRELNYHKPMFSVYKTVATTIKKVHYNYTWPRKEFKQDHSAHCDPNKAIQVWSRTCFKWRGWKERKKRLRVFLETS